MPEELKRLGAVFAGGAAGALARWSIGEAVPLPPQGFPLGTFVVNTSGAFLLAFFSVALVARMPTDTYLRLLLGVGLLGAYTTFSTLAVEGIQLLENDKWGVAATYWLATLFAGQAAGVYGMWLARVLLPARRHRGT